MGFFVAQEETFASLLEWDKRCCSLGEFIHGDVGRFNGIFALEAPQRHSSKYPIAS